MRRGLAMVWLGIGLAAGMAEAQAQEQGDPANLARYRDANAAAVQRADPRRVVFIGDSITENWARDAYFSGDAHKLGRGISGQTLGQMLARFRQDVVALNPRVVHIMGGTNDIAGNAGPETPEQMQAYIREMAHLARAQGIAVVLATIPPAADFPWRRGLDPAPKVKALNAWIRRYAEEQHLVLADYWSALANRAGGMDPDLAADGIHPTPRGYAVMRPIAERAIAAAMAAKR